MSSASTRLRVRLVLALGAAEIRLRLRLPRLMYALTRRPTERESTYAELVRIESDPAYRALFIAGLDAALEDRLATRTAVVAEIETAAEQLRDPVQRSDHGRAA
ncbi:hypothetical protein SJX93_25110 [Streptomyces cyaneofuscatus]|uniref:hypothetical protein n=1 Tax=Streptomyces cyaneofuscatus TaxID=66883 RepID=UPI002D79789D|nr:hypothetical protein [Streptomyces cyaneofuscatus]WRO12674.1 hypothetical protein SJX93_25110 [Streptomyces cyaneofuscatus]